MKEMTRKELIRRLVTMIRNLRSERFPDFKRIDEVELELRGIRLNKFSSQFFKFTQNTKPNRSQRREMLRMQK
jgi:hypothetical protein